MAYSVGELAKRCGLTVRTLHHYEQLGLLIPSARSDAGYRLYAEQDVHTLHRILAYRQMGLPLKDIPALLATRETTPLPELLEQQIQSVRREIEERQRLLSTLERVAQRARDGDGTLTQELLDLISTQRILERHYSSEEVDEIRSMQDNLPVDALQTLKTETPRLIAATREALESGTPPDSPLAVALGHQWTALGKLVPDTKALQDKGRAMLAQEPDMQASSGVDARLIAYIDKVIAAAAAAAGAEAEAEGSTDAIPAASFTTPAGSAS